MRGRTVLAAAMISAVAIGLVVAGASGAGSMGGATEKIELRAKLSGKNEVPPADADGSGKAELTLTPKRGRVCFDIEFKRIGDAIMAHIHKGPKGVNGDIKVPFFEKLNGVPSPRKGCVHAAKPLVKRIAHNPKNWYVNVHTMDFPAGAIRGQLKDAPGAGGGSGGGGNGGGGNGGGGNGGGGGGTGGGPGLPY